MLIHLKDAWGILVSTSSSNGEKINQLRKIKMQISITRKIHTMQNCFLRIKISLMAVSEKYEIG
jgi:hypothetical protein